MAVHKHNIRRVVLDLKVSSESIARDIQQKIPAYMGNGLLQEMDKLFARFSEDKDILIIDKLELDLGTIEADVFDSEFKEILKQSLLKELENITSLWKQTTLQEDQEMTLPGLRKVKTYKSWIEIFSFFLKHGVFPWWADAQNLDMMESRVNSVMSLYASEIGKELSSTLSDPGARSRMVRQFSGKFNMELLKTLYPEQIADISLINHLVPENLSHIQNMIGQYDPEEIRSEVLSHLWMHLINHPGIKGPQLASALTGSLSREMGLDKEEIMKRLPARLRSADEGHLNVRKPTVRDLAGETKSSESDSPGPYYVGNAGLVLLWPFLEKFLERSGLVKDGRFPGTSSHHRTLLLLHFLSHNNQVFDEPQFVLTKILSGWPVSSPLKRSGKLTDAEKRECSDLIQSAVTLWKSLKNTSPDGFRTSFIMRNGVVREDGNDWLLQVERQSYDILLDTLPWTFHVVKLPWMSGVLNVEW
jgi:hypothetical protein